MLDLIWSFYDLTLQTNESHSQVTALAFSPHQSSHLVATKDDSSVHLWDTVSFVGRFFRVFSVFCFELFIILIFFPPRKQVLMQVDSHQGTPATDVAFSPLSRSVSSTRIPYLFFEKCRKIVCSFFVVVLSLSAFAMFSQQSWFWVNFSQIIPSASSSCRLTSSACCLLPAVMIQTSHSGTISRKGLGGGKVSWL